MEFVDPCALDRSLPRKQTGRLLKGPVRLGNDWIMINAADRRLILLLGSSRSGTTWLAAILNSYPEVVYSHEPLSRLHRPQLNSLIEKIKSSGTLLRQERQDSFRHAAVNRRRRTVIQIHSAHKMAISFGLYQGA